MPQSLTHLHVERLGEQGPHIILLHGWGQSLKALEPLGELLASKARVHLIDLPGFGKSAMPNSIWNSFQYAEQIVSYLKEQKIDRCYLLGHSFGGKVAMSLASKYPNYAEKLILIAPSGLKRHRTTKQQLRFQAIKFSGKLIKVVDTLLGTELFKKHFAKKFGSADYQQAGQMRPILVKSVNEDLTEQVAQIETPTLLLWGENDQETPLEIAHRLNQLIKRSKLVIFPKKGHQLHLDCGAHLIASYLFPLLSNSKG